MLPAKGSRLARWRGIVRLAGRGLMQRWLESLFILLGIALGVGVFTGMETYIRFNLSTVSEAVRSMPQLYAVQVLPRRLDLAAFINLGVPAARVDSELVEPVDFTLDDLLALRDSIPEVEYALVGTTGRGHQIVAIDGASVDMGYDPAQPGPQVHFTISTVSPDELLVLDRPLFAGAPFTWEDVKNGRRNLVLAEETARYLFPDLTPEETIGRTITTTSGLEGTIWTVVGVLADRNDDLFVAMGAEDADFRMLEAFGPTTEGDTYRQLYVTPVEGVTNEELVRQVQAYMDRVYGAGRVDVRPPDDIMAGVGTIVQILALAGLALVIAAINILNLFTARVLRRQRFTGMSIALGATRSMLFWQTAGEAILLGLIGSGLGLFVAAGAVRLLYTFLRAQYEGLAIDQYATLALTSFDAAIGFALGTGISLLFGLYPAWLAARQGPAEALRADG